MEHPATRLEEAVHQRVRLGILALLHSSERSHFTALRDTLRIDDSALSRHLRVLEQARYVRLKKGYEGKRPRTWVTLTPAGLKALERELLSMRQLMQRFEKSSVARDPTLAAVFAFAARSADESEEEVEAVPSIGSTLLGTEDLPEGFEPIMGTGPINQYAEHPPHPGASGEDDARAARSRAVLVAAGLRGGYQRAWRNARYEADRGGLAELVHVCAYEWPDEETAVRQANAFPAPGEHELDVGGLPIYAGALRHPGSPAFAGSTFAVGRVSCQVDVQGGTADRQEEIIDLGARLVREQYERLVQASGADRPRADG